MILIRFADRFPRLLMGVLDFGESDVAVPHLNAVQIQKHGIDAQQRPVEHDAQEGAAGHVKHGADKDVQHQKDQRVANQLKAALCAKRAHRIALQIGLIYRFDLFTAAFHGFFRFHRSINLYEISERQVKPFSVR